MNPDDFKMQKIFESGALAFNMGPQAGDFADYPQSNLTVLKPSEKDEKKHTVEIGGKSYDLSSDELSLLKFITQHKGDGDDEENEEDYNNVLKRALAICSNQKAKYKEELSNQ